MDQLSKDQKLILMLVVVVVVVTMAERWSGAKQTASIEQIMVGAFVSAALLLLLAYVQPQFAVGLAVVLTIAVVIAEGNPFWKAISNVTGKSGVTPVTPNVVSPQVQSNYIWDAYSNQVAKNYSSQPLAQG